MKLPSVENFASAGLLCLALLVCISVALRYLFNWPIPDTLDFSRILLGVTVFWGIALAFKQETHIQVDLLWEHLGPRARLVLMMFNQILLLVFAALFAWLVIEHVWHLVFSGKQTVDFRLPLWPFYLICVPAAIIPPALLLKRLIKNPASENYCD